MTAIPVTILSRPTRTDTAVEPLPTHEPAGIVMTTVEALTAENVRRCNDDNPYK